MSTPSWLKRLSQHGSVLAPRPSGQSGYGVYRGGDRRRRPIATIFEREFSNAVDQGWLQERSENSWTVSTSGLALIADDGPAQDDPYLNQHGVIKPRAFMTDEGLKQRPARSRDAGPLARYLNSQNGAPPILEAVHANAADIFMQDYEGSGLRSRITADWSMMPRAKKRAGEAGAASESVHRLDAKDRLFDALKAVGPGLDRLLINVLVRETGMGLAERELGWPARTGSAALKLALDRLAIHYRLQAAQPVAL